MTFFFSKHKSFDEDFKPLLLRQVKGIFLFIFNIINKKVISLYFEIVLGVKQKESKNMSRQTALTDMYLFTEGIFMYLFVFMYLFIYSHHDTFDSRESKMERRTLTLQYRTERQLRGEGTVGPEDTADTELEAGSFKNLTSG